MKTWPSWKGGVILFGSRNFRYEFGFVVVVVVLFTAFCRRNL